MNLHDITPVVITYNEEANIGRCLDALRWAQRVVVVDSGSTDATHRIVAEHANAQLVVHPFTDFAQQWSFALREAGIATPWVLALDADYLMPEKLATEISHLSADGNTSAWFANFTYCVHGRPLRGTAYGPVAVLFRPADCHFIQDGHAYRLVVDRGNTGTLHERMLHDDRKSLQRWLQSQQKYVVQEADKILGAHWSGLSWPDRLRRTAILGPPLIAFYCLVIKLGLFDGWPGWYYSAQRAVAELLLSLELVERRLTSRRHD